MELTATFRALLKGFYPVFSTPSLATFQLAMTGWILSPRVGYVTDLIVSSDFMRNGHFSDYHRFFSQAAWNIDYLWKCLAVLIANIRTPDLTKWRLNIALDWADVSVGDPEEKVTP